MSMTPYEIRLELLKMAQQLLIDDFYSKKEVIVNQWHTQVEMAKISGTESPPHPELPKFPTEEEIVKKAEALNQFVSQTPPAVEIKTKKSSS